MIETQTTKNIKVQTLQNISNSAIFNFAIRTVCISYALYKITYIYYTGCYLRQNFHLPFRQVTSKIHLPKFVFNCQLMCKHCNEYNSQSFSFSPTFIGLYVLTIFILWFMSLWQNSRHKAIFTLK
jgi:hypothetical protein